MSDLFNIETRKKEVFNNPEELHAAILSGKYAYKAGTKVRTTGPDGKPYHIPAEHIANAIEDGYTVETDIERATREYVKENDNIKGALKVGAYQAANQFALGLPDIIKQKTGNPYEVAKLNANKEQHEFANYFGGGIGFTGSLFALSPVAKVGQLVERSLASRLAIEAGTTAGTKALAKGIMTKAAASGIENAVVAAPQAITEAALGEPDRAAETLLMGLGIGSVFGAGGHLGGKMAAAIKESELANKAKTQIVEALKDKMNPNALAVEALNPTVSKLGKTQAVEEAFNEAGEVVGTTVSKDLDKVGETLRNYGIMDDYAIVDPQKGFNKKLESSLDDLSANIRKDFDLLDNTYGTEALINKNELGVNIINAIENNVDLKIKHGNLRPAFYKELNNFIDEIPTEFITLNEANHYKALIQDKVKASFGTETYTIKDMVNTIPKEINKMVREKTLSLDRAVGERIIKNQVDFANLAAAKKISDHSVTREAANNDFGLTSYISGGAGATVGATTGALIAGPAGAAVGGALGGAVGAVLRNYSRTHGNQILSNLFAKNSKGILIAEQAMKNTGKRLDEIKGALDKIGKYAPKVRKSNIATSAAIRLLGEGDSKEAKNIPDLTKPANDRAKDFMRINKNVGAVINSPESMQQTIEKAISFFTENEAPMIGTHYGMKLTATLQYLHSITPKPPRPNSPFASNKAWQPSFSETEKFNRKLDVILDPFVVIEELKTGTLTQDHVEALEAVYPVIYQDIKSKIIEEVTANPTQLPFKARVQLGILFKDPNLDPLMTPQAVQALQGSLAVEAENEQASIKNFNAAEGVATEAQRIAE